MPKVNNLKQKRTERKPPPTGAIKTMEELDAEEEFNENIDEEQTPEVNSKYPVLELLSSTESEKRECACADLSRIVMDSPDTIKIILEQGALKKLIDNVCDPNLGVRVAAAGALRNLTLVGGEEIAEQLVQKDCMGPVVTILQQTYSKVLNSTDKSTEEVKSMLSLLTQIMALLANICENSEKATLMFTQSKAALFVLSFLKQDLPLELKVNTAQLLNVVTDENPEVAQQILGSPEHTQIVQWLIGNDNLHILLRVVSSGFAYNMRNPQSRFLIVKTILPILIAAIDFDIVANLFKLEPYFHILNESEELDRPANTGNPSANPVSNGNKGINADQAESALEEWKYCLEAQKTSLEILANICTEDSPDEEAEVNIPKEIVEIIGVSGIFMKVLNRCGNLSAELIEKLKPLKFIKPENIVNIQLNALSSVSNMLLMFNKLDDPLSVWNFLCSLCVPSASADLLETILAAMWTLLRKCGNPIPFVPSQQQLELLSAVTKLGATGEIKMSGAAIFGIIGQHPAAANFIGEIGILLLGCLTDSSLEVRAEALNSVFDVFAETNYNQVVVQLGMIQKLSECHSHLKKVLQSRALKLDRHLSSRVEEAELNLERFLEYKAAHFK